MRPLRRLRGDDRGALLVFVAVALAALLGLVALSFDLGRMAATQTELQSFADNVALAAAAELDGKDDSIERATRAANNLITDRQSFGEGGRLLDLNDFTLTFMSDLDPDDQAPYADVVIPPPYNAAEAREARLVKVDIVPREVELTFASAVFSLTRRGEPNTDMGATAIAGFTEYACAITPLFFCLPSPAYTADANIGDMVILTSGVQGDADDPSWGAGNFGFLDPTSLEIDPRGPCGSGKLSGRNLYSCLTGADGALTQCVATRGGLTTEPGHKSGVTEAAFNVRFDIYRQTMGGETNEVAYAPAPNVTKGTMRNGGPSPGNVCMGMNTEPTGNSIGLPRDACITAGNCPDGRFGNGTWNRAEYLRRNHNNVAPPRAPDSDPRLANTRYQMYLDEIAQAGGTSATTPILPAQDTTGTPPNTTTRWTMNGGNVRPATETGRPMCSRHQSSDPDRRVVIAAGVDCTTFEVKGRTTDVEVQEFFRIFLTEPVRDDGASPPNVELTGEIIGSAGRRGSAGIFRDVVQLYR